MAGWRAAWLGYSRLWCGVALAVLAPPLFGCSRPTPHPRREQVAAQPAASGRSPLTLPSSATSSRVAAVEREMRATKLRLPARRPYAPQLAFGTGVLGQLTADALRVFETGTFQQVASIPLEGPRAVLAMVDGSLLVVSARSLLRWDRHKDRATRLARPVLLPTAQVFADALDPGRLWVFEDAKAGATGAKLHAYRLAPDAGLPPLPEQTLELGQQGRDGVLGTTREGVWLYLSPGHAQRFSPGGLKLSSLKLGEAPLPTWVLPGRRLDQSVWVHENGALTRNLVSPTFKQLASSQVKGQIFDATVGNEGRLLALLLVVGPGPAFALELRDPELVSLALVELPSDTPTSGDDWVRGVTANQNVAVSLREAKVAVGGPSRLTVLDGQGRRIFSIPSM